MEKHLERDDYCRSVLLDEFDKAKKKNVRFSLRAYARYLGINPSTLCQVLNGNRKLSAADAVTISKRINFVSSHEAEKFIVQASSKSDKPKRKKSSLIVFEEYLDANLHRSIIENDHYYTILNILRLSHFKGQIENIARKAELPVELVKSYLKDLIKVGLVEEKANGDFRVTKQSTRTSDDVSSQSIRIAHKNTLHNAEEALDEVAVDQRDFVSLKLPANPEMLPEAKKEIRKFLKKMHRLLNKGESTEVYECAVQLFPRTQARSKHEN